MNRRVPRALLAVAAATVLATGTASRAAATDTAATPTHSGHTSATATNHRYWTAQRMRAATPADPPSAGTSAPAPAPSTGPAARVRGARGTAVRADSGLFSMTGRIFFTEDDGTDHSCTGSTVNSDGKNLVFTAGHCVHGQGSGHAWWTNWAFVPGYDNGSAPHGTWYSSWLWSMQGWTTDGNRYYDVGVAIMDTDANGNHIVDALGGQGIEWNYGYQRDVHDFGYPADPPYDGSTMYYCTGTTYPSATSLGTFPGLDCNMNGGASGGPWLDGYSDGTWSAYLYTVNSWMYYHGSTDDDVYRWEAPYFGDDVKNLYDDVANL
ncbi:hypothetical protein Athai_11970 [Actinocatenispora thailandica]|uniref:Peptidase n=1 Tax=Actinocatenispora thailandica TaxID=227318 RepID=A0A7R7HW81_9ACTN|nr:hypothetical protein [Actinocatenispora thailandica]BCJ33694.1 hypothetical protein Athai_11970 [Actinocatenispora thailandica]